MSEICDEKKNGPKSTTTWHCVKRNCVQTKQTHSMCIFGRLCTGLVFEFFILEIIKPLNKYVRKRYISTLSISSFFGMKKQCCVVRGLGALKARQSANDWELLISFFILIEWSREEWGRARASRSCITLVVFFGARDNKPHADLLAAKPAAAKKCSSSRSVAAH